MLYVHVARLRTLLLLLALSVFTQASVSQASGLLHADGNYFKDAQGRVVLLRGVDVSNAGKTPPFNPLPDFTVIQKMKDWGINNIRLAFIWEAYEPVEGQYNTAYLDRLAQVIDAAGKLGINTVIDFHTDAFSRYSDFGCGSGFPKWALPPDVSPSTPHNGLLCTIWATIAGLDNMIPFSGYHKTISDFYSDAYGVRTRFIKAWSQIAHYFKDNANVIGYDVLNEPWGDEKKDLAPLYEDAAKAIRAEDPKAILFLEPYLMVDLGWPGGLPTPSFGNIAYAPHDYDPFALGLRIWFTGGLFIDNILKGLESTAKHLNAPIYMGEYGASGGSIGMKGLTKHYYRLFDKNFISGGQWDISAWNSKNKDGWNFEDMSIMNADESIRGNFMVRPFPMAVAGVPGEIKEDFPKNVSTGKKLSFSWENQPELGQTVFFIPKYTLGGRAFVVDFKSDDESLNCIFDTTTFLFSCTSPNKGTEKIEISIH